MRRYIKDNDDNKISIGTFNKNTREVNGIDTNYSLNYEFYETGTWNTEVTNYFKNGRTETRSTTEAGTNEISRLIVSVLRINVINSLVIRNGDIDDIAELVGYYFVINEINSNEMTSVVVYRNGNGEIIYKINSTGDNRLLTFDPSDLFGSDWEDELEIIEAYPNESEEDGGYGDKDLSSDTIDLPDLPSITGLTSNFISVYAPSNVQLNQLADFMWTSDFLDNFKKIWSNPMENLISLAIMPFNVNTNGTGTVVIGYWLTDVTMPKVTRQFQEIDCGSLKIGKYYNSFLDYSPYTKIHIYLPFIGIRQLKVDEIMGKTISVKYRVDVVSGACVAYILVNNSIFYQFNGNCATTIPITNADYSNLINANLQTVSGAITMSAGIAGGSPVAAGSGASMVAGGMIDIVTSTKPDINKSGNMAGSNGMMGVKTPFLMKEIPRQSWAKDNNKYKGIPSNVSSKLSALKGYTEIDKINLSDIKATEKEMIEIENLLKQGVIL